MRGEAPAGCRRCRELTACALVRDQELGIALRARWYGWRAAREHDIELIEQARETGLCDRYPVCRFVGNGRDLEVWARKGWVPSTTRVLAYCNEHGCSVCVPALNGKYQEE
ncbi:hypothetical protein GF380_00585 [Candidatus Uhrbacteria bacterium]|nr:hypothetical protein [Candidatus Uhrbacteria bacterium]